MIGARDCRPCRRVSVLMSKAKLSSVLLLLFGKVISLFFFLTVLI